MRSFINAGSKAWNLSKEEQDAIEARKNFRYEEEFTTYLAAFESAKVRRSRSNRKVYIYKVAEDKFIHCVHGVAKIGWKLETVIA